MTKISCLCWELNYRPSIACLIVQSLYRLDYPDYLCLKHVADDWGRNNICNLISSKLVAAIKSASLNKSLFYTHSSAEYSFKVQCHRSLHYCHHFQDFRVQRVNGMKGQGRHGRRDMQHKDLRQMETPYVKQEPGGKITMLGHETVSEDVRGSRCVMFYTILSSPEQISSFETLIMGNGFTSQNVNYEVQSHENLQSLKKWRPCCLQLQAQRLSA